VKSLRNSDAIKEMKNDELVKHIVNMNKCYTVLFKCFLGGCRRVILFYITLHLRRARRQKSVTTIHSQ